MYYRIGKSMYRNLVAGVDAKVPLKDGMWVTGINFDNGATTPPFISVLQEMINFAPWYSSIHRGTGYKSLVSTEQYEKARDTILDFIKADKKYYTVIFVKNTTEAINKLSYRFCENKMDCVVLSTGMEHHSNDLPWRDKYHVDYIDTDKCGRLSLNDLEEKLVRYKGKVKLVTVTGASNVTGYINPIHKIAEIVHKYKAKILVDGAQLVPHVPVDMKDVNSLENIDYLVFSAHKMYAPFGIGVLVAPKKLFEEGSPEYSGGGTVKIVTKDNVIWEDPPNKEEAGSPNIMGVIALASAIKTLKLIGMENIYKYENNLVEYALKSFERVPDLQVYCDNDGSPRVGIIPFNIDKIPHVILAEALAGERGIAVREGCFCAQPYIQKLLNVSAEELKEYMKNVNAPRKGMTRVSFGIYNDCREIEILTETLIKISKNKEKYLRKYAQ